MLLATAVAASRYGHKRNVSSALTSYGLFLASALAVHLADGATEAHFTFFVMIIIVSLYEDWRPFLIAFGFVVLHHGVMGLVDRGSVYDHAGNPWLLALIHGAFVAAAGVACVVTWSANEGVRAEVDRANERARESDALFRSAFEDGPIGMALVALTKTGLGTLLQVNRTLSAQFGYRRASCLVGVELHELLAPESIDAIRRCIDALIASELTVAHEELRLLHHHGFGFEAHMSMSLVAGATGASRDLVVQIQDVTERNRLKHELQDLADHDPLTGLLNRRRFGQELAARAERRPPLAVVRRRRPHRSRRIQGGQRHAWPRIRRSAPRRGRRGAAQRIALRGRDRPPRRRRVRAADRRGDGRGRAGRRPADPRPSPHSRVHRPRGAGAPCERQRRDRRLLARDAADGRPAAQRRRPRDVRGQGRRRHPVRGLLRRPRVLRHDDRLPRMAGSHPARPRRGALCDVRAADPRLWRAATSPATSCCCE